MIPKGNIPVERLNLVVALLLALGGVGAYLAADHSVATTDTWFQQAVLNNERPVVVKFGADWCGPCRSMDAALHRIQGQFTGARFVTINIDEKPQVWREFRSGTGIPQIAIFHKGQMVAHQRGFGGEAELQKWLTNNL